MVLQPGTRLRDYEIISLIGTGGMGEVYKAKELTLDREVAIKVLTSRGLDDPLFLQRFVNEAKIHARLSHSNIVDIYTFFEEAKVHYIAMQYAPGITLTELIRTTGLIPEPRALAIFRQICEALAYAHARGVVHRDVKPSNVMVDPQDGDRVKVMDFGIARLLGAQHITRTGTQMGTVCYMSPEQVLGEKEIDHRSDIYSAGVLLYEMLSGTLPYNLDTDSLFKIQNRILQEPLPDPREAYPHISDGTVALLRSFTQKEREDRPGEILETLGVYVGSNNISNDTIAVPPDNSSNNKQDIVTVIDKPFEMNRLETPITSVPFKRHTISKKMRLGAILSLSILIIVVIASFVTKKSVKPLMINVESGSFTTNYGFDVTVSPFSIGKFEVTQKEWIEIIGTNPSHFKGDNRPVESVTWYDAIEYCNKRSLKENLIPCYTVDKSVEDSTNTSILDNFKWTVVINWKANGYRLPTGAEWEFAARGGKMTKHYNYSGSNNLSDVAWSTGKSVYETQVVGTKQANEIGIHDMSGNVWEWCWDWSGSRYFSEDYTPDPRGTSSGSSRVMRGGGWNSPGNDCRVFYCDGSYPSYSSYNVGFRVVRAIF